MKVVQIATTLSVLVLGAVSTALPDSTIPHGTVTSATPRVGVLMDDAGGHWCTASVVHSPHGNLLLTAAHCVDDGEIFFVPAYADGQRPLGTWQVVGRHTDADADVSFLVVDRPVEPITGAYSLAFGDVGSEPGAVSLIGYPDALDTPITCSNTVTHLDVGLRIDCTDFSDGTSGSPWVAGGDTVVGIIGGYEEGGLTEDVSYSPSFDSGTRALYLEAIS